MIVTTVSLVGPSSNISRSFSIATLPQRGILYQYSGTKRQMGPRITQLNTNISDPNGRIVYEGNTSFISDQFAYRTKVGSRVMDTVVAVNLSLIYLPTT